MASLLYKSINQAKKVIIGVIGFTVLLIGIAMIVLPGPAFVIIPLGLGILATEFVWAKRVLDNLKTKLKKSENRSICGRGEE